MNYFRVILLAFLFCLATTSMLCGQVESLPEGGSRLIDANKVSPDAITVWMGNGDFGEKEVHKVDHPDFDKALKITIKNQPGNTWDTSVSAVTTAAVKKGDAIVIGFWARGKQTHSTGGGVTEAVFETKGEPYTKSVQYLVETPADGSWKHYWIRFLSLADYQPGGALLNFQTGYVREELELANVEVWNFGDTRKLHELPHTPLTYAGRDSDAAWRVEANRRIEQHRKAEMEITVVDAAGKPVAGVPVHVRLNRHAFGFGTAVSARRITGDGQDNEKYRQTLLENFSLTTIENGLKWRIWDNQPDYRLRTLQAVQWLDDQHIPVRGHVMVWPGYRHLPEWIESLKDNPEALKKVIDQHIREVGYATRGHVRDWDVLNEVFDNLDLTSLLGDESMVHWFQVADEVLPDVDLYYNDYAGLVRGGHPTGHKDHFEKTIRYLVDNGAPIDGIGIQGHFGALLTPPERLLSELDRWAELGLKIQITEFDVTVPDEELRADFTRDFLISCFSHPAVNSIVAWGFWESSHWRPAAAFFDKDWNLTPMGKQWTELTQKEWHTDETLTSDSQGRVKLRGFLGKYEVTCQENSSRVELKPGDSKAIVRISR